jgi:UDP-N-acetylmuramyl pentapeptide phosphotransferase/UDP-N-acetylglucosamine-1-phosphate transferase
VDDILANYTIASLLFTMLIIGGATNSLNIIDGNNGLMLGYGILAALAFIYIAYAVEDILIIQLGALLVATLLPILLFNFPFGKIFSGDGGAYFIGFTLALIGLMLARRHQEISNWFVLLVFIYPMYEVLYSMYRRKLITRSRTDEPDALHLHSLIYRKVISCKKFKNNPKICNSMVSPLIWLLSLAGILPAIVWYNNQTVLIVFAFIFMTIYTLIYKYLSKDKFKLNH